MAQPYLAIGSISKVLIRSYVACSRTDIASAFDGGLSWLTNTGDKYRNQNEILRSEILIEQEP
jgi:hypothetical protein